MLPMITGTLTTKLFYDFLNRNEILLDSANSQLMVGNLYFPFSNKTPISHQMHNLNSRSDNLNANNNHSLSDSIEVFSVS